MLDPNMAIGCAYFLEIGDKRVARTTGVSMSYERVDNARNRIDSANKDIPRGIIIWAHSTDAEGKEKLTAVVGKDRPLEVSIEGEELIIRIGMGVLAWAADHQDDWNPLDYEDGNFYQSFRVSDPEEFAKDVVRALLEEAEDGSTPLGDLLDRMSTRAMEDGSFLPV